MDFWLQKSRRRDDIDGLRCWVSVVVVVVAVGLVKVHTPDRCYIYKAVHGMDSFAFLSMKTPNVKMHRGASVQNGSYHKW